MERQLQESVMAASKLQTELDQSRVEVAKAEAQTMSALAISQQGPTQEQLLDEIEEQRARIADLEAQLRE